MLILPGGMPAQEGRERPLFAVDPFISHACISCPQTRELSLKLLKMHIKKKNAYKEKPKEDKYHMILLIWTLKYDTNEPIYEAETDS